MKNPEKPEPHDRQVHPAAPSILSSKDLLGERRELVILHEGEMYRLRITKNNKLILTK